MKFSTVIVFLGVMVVAFVITSALKNISAFQEVDYMTSIEFEARSYDFGEIPPRKDATVYFIFTNSGSKDLQIDRIDARCGCTAISWPTRLIKPKEVDSILVKYDAEQEGFFSKEVFVFSNAGTSPDLLTVRGTVGSRNRKVNIENWSQKLIIDN